MRKLIGRPKKKEQMQALSCMFTVKTIEEMALVSEEMNISRNLLVRTGVEMYLKHLESLKTKEL